MSRRIHRRYRDFGQLLGIRIDNEPAVGKYHRAFRFVKISFEQHQHETRYRTESGQHADDLQRRAHAVTGGVDRAGNGAVGVTRMQHQIGKTQRVTRLLFGLFAGHALVLAQLQQVLTISLVVL